jgi:gas vesicle protein
MSKRDSMPMFLAGLGIGAAVGLLWVPVTGSQFGIRARKAIRNTTDNLANRSRSIAESVSSAMPDAGETWKKGEKTMSDVKDKLKDKIDDTADATKKAVDKVADKAKEAAHEAGKKLEQGGKNLQKA